MFLQCEEIVFFSFLTGCKEETFIVMNSLVNPYANCNYPNCRISSFKISVQLVGKQSMRSTDYGSNQLLDCIFLDHTLPLIPTVNSHK